MQVNYAVQHSSKLAWDGAAAAPIDIRNHVGFTFSFEVMQDLGNDTIFNVMSAPPSDVDPCVPGPWEPVPEVLTCVAGFSSPPPVAMPQATIVLPTGTPKGSICSATLPCRPNAFLSLGAGGGDTGSVRVTAGLHLPKR